MALMKKSTGNLVSDLMLDGHPYDYKLTTDISLTKNWIVYLNYSYFSTFKTSEKYLYDLKLYMKSEISKNLNLTEEQKKFYSFAEKKLEIICNDPKLTPLEKIFEWNNFIFETLHNRPKMVMLPILIPTSSAPFNRIPLPQEYNEIPFPISKSLNPDLVYDYAKQLMESWSHERKGITYKATKGMLGSSDNVDNHNE